MFDWLNPFSKAITSVEKVASEWIETNQEKAEAQAVLLKAMDPNGLMRIEITRRVLGLYALYMIIMILLLGCEFFNFVPSGTSVEQMASATTKLKELFLPITGMATMIVSASFGVNWQNSKNESAK